MRTPKLLRQWGTPAALSLLLFLAPTVWAEDPVHFHDARLQAAVEAALHVTNPTPAQMLDLTELSAQGEGIADLTGLEYATNLTDLDLDENQIGDLSPLAGLIHLLRLYLEANRISTISPLAGLANLTDMDLDENQITDIAVLAGLTNLTDLDLDENQISDLAPLAGLTHLTWLDVANNQVSDLSPLAGLTRLTWLDAGDNQIRDLSPLAGLTHLTELRLSANQIRDISVLAGLTRLRGVWLHDNRISDLAPLAGLTNLSRLNLRRNPLNREACASYIPQIEVNNPGIDLGFSPCVDTCVLTTLVTGQGWVTEPGEDSFGYTCGTLVSVVAMPDRGGTFTGWTGTAVDAGKVADPGRAETTVIVDGTYILQANFMGAATHSTWYVDAAAAGRNDGSSWENAFTCLQEALANPSLIGEIHVAEGLYQPDRGPGQGADDRAATFRLQRDVAIYGGFPTGGGTWEQRNPFLHQSILSGDIGDPRQTNDNSYHVVTAAGTDQTAILDGCTITGGFANGVEPQDRGAGLYNLRGSPQIRNCIFAGNTALLGAGGGACNIEGDTTFTNCVFHSNTAGNDGGGVYNEQGNVTITNCTFAANQGLRRGGGVFNASGMIVITNSILWANGRMGGASYDEWAQIAGDVLPTVDHCCVQRWTGSLGGQGNFGRDPLFLDTDGPDDVAGTPDDDLRLQAGSPCIDRGDTAAVPTGISADQQGKPRLVRNAVDVGAYEFGEVPAPSGSGGL